MNREQMKHIIDQLNPDNIDRIKDALICCIEMYRLEHHHNITFKPEEEREEAPSEEDTKEDAITEDDTQDSDVTPYTFKRILHGGIGRHPVNIPDEVDSTLDIRVTESAAQYLSLKTGDIITPYNPEDPDDKSVRVLKRTDGEERVEIRTLAYAQPVAHPRFGFIITHYIDTDGIRKSVEDLTPSVKFLIINRKDHKFHDIDEDSLVSVAWYQDSDKDMNTSLMCRVRSVVDTARISYQKPGKASDYKEKDTEQKTCDPFLKDLTVAIFGGPSSHQGYKEAIEQHGGRADLYDKIKQSDQMIRKALLNADIAVVPVSETSHKMALAVKKYIGEMDMPVIYLEHNGRGKLLSELRDVVEKEGIV